MSALFLSRVRLRRDAPAVALARLLVPEAPAERMAASHRLIWSLFADHATRTRDFLWREEAPGRFIALSQRPPTNLDDLFELAFKPFEPVLAMGDRLGFTLRANPVVARPEVPGQRGKRHDVVMDLLRHVSPGARADTRPQAILDAGRAWLDRQGEAHGFVSLEPAAVDGYQRVQIPRAGAQPARFGVLDISGVLEVRDPARFLAQVAQGFGRARSFGCGLMLIRRVRS
jgi:CRISPR system Cascade subunit CasE